MGPRLVSRGKTTDPVGHVTAIELQWGRDLLVTESQTPPPMATAWAALQWGRDLLVAERWDDGIADCWRGGQLQWGRDLLVAESRKMSDEILSVVQLQWGRDLLVAESAHYSFTFACASAASMGPRLVSRGKLGCHWALERRPLMGASKDTSHRFRLMV